MNVHENARLTAHSRAELVRRVLDQGQPRRVVAAAFGVDPKTVGKCVNRFRAEGAAGLADRSSRPHRLRVLTPPEVQERIIALRRQRFTGQQIAREATVSPATVSRILRRVRLSRIRDLEPPEPVRRYERDHPGDMIHIDIKRLGRFDQPGHRVTGDRTGQSNGRGVGWEFVHVSINDASRIAFSQILPDEKAASAVPFLRAAIDYYAGLGVTVTRVMTDNGSCYKAFAFRDAQGSRPAAHPDKALHSKTNGKAERFIQTALRDWAYAQKYQSSDRRAAELPFWLRRYNWHRPPPGGIKLQTPISRLAQLSDRLL